MSAVVDLGKVLEVEVGIYLGRSNAGVAQQLLHGAKVAARFQQMAGKGMA